jgi:hypothetical protein
MEIVGCVEHACMLLLQASNKRAHTAAGSGHESSNAMRAAVGMNRPAACLACIAPESGYSYSHPLCVHASRFLYASTKASACLQPTVSTWQERDWTSCRWYVHLLHVRTYVGTWIMNTCLHMHRSPSWFRYEPNAYMYVYIYLSSSLRAVTLTWLVVGPLYTCILHFPGFG